MAKVLFDANVLLDFFLERHEDQEGIKKLFSLVDQGVGTGLRSTRHLEIGSSNALN